MNGNIYAFETPAPFHPLKSWPQQVQGNGNGFTARHGWVGVAATADSRTAGDVGGDTFLVQFDIVDNRPLAHTPMVCMPFPLPRTPEILPQLDFVIPRSAPARYPRESARVGGRLRDWCMQDIQDKPGCSGAQPSCDLRLQQPP
jgi:hypothetical protein